MRYLRPDVAVSSIHAVDYEALRDRGIGALIYDLENTLCRWRHWQLDARTQSLLCALRARGMRIAVLTNARIPPDHPLVQTLEEAGVRVVASARKPLRSGLRRALAALAACPGEAAMIGDQLLTDVLGGKRAGLYTVLVDPVGPKESFPTKLNRLVEWLLGRRPVPPPGEGGRR